MLNCIRPRPTTQCYDRRSARSPIVVVLLLLAGCTTLKRCAYEGINRDDWQKPDEVIRALGIKPGDRIADIGSGSGYFTFRLARAVGPTGRVYAVDIDKGLNDYVAKKAGREGFSNIEIILAKPHDANLPRSGVDLIFTSNTYHHLTDRPAYFGKMSSKLRPNARIAIIEFSDKGWFPEFSGHATSPAIIKTEMKKAGYALQREFDFLPIFSTHTK